MSTLLRHLDHKRFELHLAVLEAQGPYLKDIPRDVFIHELRVSRLRYALPRIVKLVWEVKPRVVLSNQAHVNLGVILAKPLLPRSTRLFIREASTPAWNLKQKSRFPGVWFWLYRRLYKRADRVVCLSDSMIDDMALYFKVPRQKLVRIYNPLDSGRIKELAAARSNPFPSPGPHLVAAGRLAREKGFDLLLAAMPSVCAHFPKATLTILGEGPLRAALTSQAHALGLADRVRFPGFQDNPWPYLKFADVFVLSSHYEGLPNVVLEALALGTPVVATDCAGGIREIQAFYPELVTVPPNNKELLAHAIISTCATAGSGDGGRRASSGRQVSEFSLPHVVGEYSRLLSS